MTFHGIADRRSTTPRGVIIVGRRLIMWFPTFPSLSRPGSQRGRVVKKPRSLTPAIESLEERSVPSFLGPLTSPGGGGALTVGDFNHDGRADVVVIGSNGKLLVSLST